MLSCRFGGLHGAEVRLQDQEDVVVIRTRRRGARHDVSPLARRSRAAMAELEPLFGFAPAGVGVWAAPAGGAGMLAEVLSGDPEIEFAGRGLRDEHGAPVVYTENVFVKFAASVPQSACLAVLGESGFAVKRPLAYAGNAFFAGGEPGLGRDVFAQLGELLARDDVELCHPELVRQIGWNGAAPQQWHLQPAVIGDVTVDAHANVVAAWEHSQGEGVIIAIIDDGVDVGHDEFSAAGKVVAPRSLTPPRSDDPRPSEGHNHGTFCSGVACASGERGASGVAPKARLMPLRLVSGLGSQDEADAFVWAAEHGADVISCSWGPCDGEWWDPDDPRHGRVALLPDATRLAIDFAVAKGRGGRGCVITWAAGNGDESVDNDHYASNEKVVTVAACNDTGKKAADSDHGRAVWCCFPSGDVEPSLTPGIWTTDRTGRDGVNQGDASLGDVDGNYTNSFAGTSSACPGVAGVAALVLAADPDLRWEEVKEILRRSCDRIDATAGEYDEEGHSPRYGFGRVNAEAAVRLAREAGSQRRGTTARAPAAPSSAPASETS